MIEIQGWLSPIAAEAMRDLILDTKPNVCVEIGVFGGKSLINSALAMKKNGRGKIYGIDSWRRRDAYRGLSPNDNEELWRTIDLDAVHNACMQAIWEHELEEYVVVIRSAAKDCRQLFSDIDILYIDDGHSEEASVNDVWNYLPRVKRGGYIWLDDTDWPSLQKAVQLLGLHCDREQDLGFCHLYKRR